MTTSARRQLFRRSKAGCWKCRSKKKKCDELRPHCTRCIRAGENCRYPDASSESLSEASSAMATSDYTSPSMPSSASFPNSLSSHAAHAAPMLSRSSSTSGYSSHASRHASHRPYHHHPYAPPQAHHLHSPPQHRDFQMQRPQAHQRLSPPARAASHISYHPAQHGGAPAHLPQQQFPPPPLSASAAAEWDHTSQQHVYKRTRYDELSSSSSSTSSNQPHQDARAGRQPFEPHHRVPSNHSQGSSKGKSRDTLPPISPHQPYSIPMAASASLPPFNAVSPQQPRTAASPILSTRSADTSPNSQASPYFANGPKEEDGNASFARREAATKHAEHSAGQLNASASGIHSEAVRSPTTSASTAATASCQKLVLDYSSTEPDPEELLAELTSYTVSTVTQQTKGSTAYFSFLHGIARMAQGQAMAHALAAMVATQQAKRSCKPQERQNDAVEDGAEETRALDLDASQQEKAALLLDLADRHHLAAIKALQTQTRPSRRRRFSVIESNSSTSADDLPAGSNAAAMMLLILACSFAGKSLMLPSYFNQCEQFLADAVEHVSSHRLFPSVTGEMVSGNAEDPPIEAPESVSAYGTLLFLGTVVGLYECYLAMYTAVTDWDYNPARLRRLLPFNWTEADAAIFDQARGVTSETVYSVSMVTWELIIETLDTMRKLRRAETVAYGGKKSSRSEADDGGAALDSLALREELGLLIRDLEAGAFWKGSHRILSEAEQLQVLDSLRAADAGAGAGGKQSESSDASAQMPPPSVPAEDAGSVSATQAFRSGALFLASTASGSKQVNRLRLANHLYRNALLVDLYVTVFNRAPSSLAVRELVSRSAALFNAIPDKLEQGLMWPAMVLGSYAEGAAERNQIRAFFARAQWKGIAGPATTADVVERVWAQDAPNWRESVSYFGSPYIS
ncbi:hypothetical protein PaG_02962 [Moesziomyces aphidis]|uniref:Zn(2)-C6 fungal-type domain-containing protein n=1 Tax=Moesziomyces aphidis TaxID=84754 RepID=W3VNU4_MOEAP|nr:hypothetical protein PaG_02962 [Moesziomyces aphidis]